MSGRKRKKEIHAQIMGEIQMEILKSLIAERFGVNVRFGGRSIVYKETITDTVEGVGHFEPLRHYAEVHLLLEPGEPGSGLVFDTDCSEDILSKNWQRLVLTHLEEKVHRGVLIGAPITDMKITLKSGRAHVKHTEGGDFRQSVYRAVRQGLMQAHSVLLEPFYAFHLTIPDKMVGRAMTDLERRFAVFEGPALEDGQAILTGRAPVSALDGYQTEVTVYTGGLGQMICTLDGYGPCHNEEEIIAAAGYDPDADLANPSGSVFCTHGAGFVVNWDEVKDYMHLESCLGDSNGKRRMEAIPEVGCALLGWTGRRRCRKKCGSERTRSMRFSLAPTMQIKRKTAENAGGAERANAQCGSLWCRSVRRDGAEAGSGETEERFESRDSWSFGIWK